MLKASNSLADLLEIKMRNYYAYDRDGDNTADDCAELGAFEAENMDAALIEARRLWPTTAEIRVVDLSAGPGIGDEAMGLVNQFSSTIADMFDQRVKGNWVDQLGHPVKNNTAMQALKVPLMGVQALLARRGAAPVKPTGMDFHITFTHPDPLQAVEKFDLVGFCVSVVDSYGMTEAEVAAVVSLRVGESFANEDMTVRRVA
jgi:hypothetical protein